MKTITNCVSFVLGDTLLSVSLPLSEEIKASERTAEACSSAMLVGADFNYQLQQKWERILMFFENIK